MGYCIYIVVHVVLFRVSRIWVANNSLYNTKQFLST